MGHLQEPLALCLIDVASTRSPGAGTTAEGRGMLAEENKQDCHRTRLEGGATPGAMLGMRAANRVA